MDLTYQIQIIPVARKKGGKPNYYLVLIPALNGQSLCTDGSTPQEAVEMAIEYIQCHTEALQDLGKPVPETDMWNDEEDW